MFKRPSPLLHLAVVILLGVTAGEAQAARRKLRSSATAVSQATPRTFWALIGDAFAYATKSKGSADAAAAPATRAFAKSKNQMVEQGQAPLAAPLVAASPRRPLGAVPIVVISPPKPVVSNP